MTTIPITPPDALGLAAQFAQAAGWKLAPFTGPSPTSPAALAATEEPVLVVPQHAGVPEQLRRVVVVHEGSPAAAPAMTIADDVAVRSGAEITVLHVASPARPSEAGSLPAPCFVDHGGYDWQEWRAEFLRRFCRCSEGLCVRLEIVTGDPAETIGPAVRRLHPDLVVATWKGHDEPGRSQVLRALLEQAPCPVLVLRERATVAQHHSPAP